MTDAERLEIERFKLTCRSDPLLLLAPAAKAPAAKAPSANGTIPLHHGQVLHRIRNAILRLNPERARLLLAVAEALADVTVKVEWDEPEEGA